VYGTPSYALAYTFHMGSSFFKETLIHKEFIVFSRLEALKTHHGELP
jgi:hypothetical protein